MNKLYHVLTTAFIAITLVMLVYPALMIAHGLHPRKSRNGLHGNAVKLDTVISILTGSSSPPVHNDGATFQNGDFTIGLEDETGPTGDGIDETTYWRFLINPPNNNPLLEVISTTIILHYTQKDPAANNDDIRIEDCGCGAIGVNFFGVDNPGVFTADMMDVYSAEQLLDSLVLSHGITMSYQDDAIVTEAELRMVVQSAPAISIVAPLPGELWIAGETDTIKWNSSGVDSVNILLSENYENNAGSFNELVHGYPADSGKYIWQIPDTMLSRKCAIEIQSTSDANIDTIGPVFRIKSYELARVTPDSNYERFLPNKDGWQFRNGDTSKLWPAAWWNQFFYSSTGIDPNTNSAYSAYFQTIPGTSFPDWPSFVDAFGTSACYWSTILAIYKDQATGTWGPQCQPYNGSCYGLANSSMLAFDNSIAFYNRFPNITVPPAQSLFSYPMSVPIRMAIDQCFNYQYGKIAKDNDLANAVTRPKTTLAQLKAMFLSETNDHRTLCFFNPAGRGAHQVTPIRIAGDPATTSWVRIYLYNSNSPGVTTDYILVDTLLNQWKESTGFGWGWGTSGMYLDISSSSLIPQAVLNKNTPLSFPSSIKQENEPLDITTSINCNVRIFSAGGDSIGSIQGAVFNSMTNGIPIIPKTGFPDPPTGYYLQFGPYTGVIDSSSDSLISFSVLENGTSYRYGRSDAKQNQHDLLSLGDGLALKNPDASAKLMNLTTVISSDSSDKSYDMVGCVLSQNDSVAMKSINQEDLKLTNAGSSKSYTLKLHIGSASGEARFEHPGIIFASNSSQQIIPNWTDLSQPIKIYVDIGNDGTIDDSIFVDNQVTGVKDRKGKELPKAFALLQNYPNPFNPMTVISYSLASQVQVKLSVYNILGEEVKTLVDEVQSAGYKSVSFNANNLPSGMYTYRLTAGTFTDVKKMVLLK